jgi:hypothetical protein
MKKYRTSLFIYISTGLLLLMFGQMILSAVRKAPTYDEQGYIARGYAWVKLNDRHILIGTPILLNMLNALPLLSLPDVRLPTDAPSWQGTRFHPIGERFMWRVNDNADQILLMARVPTMMLALLLAVFCYRWAKELFGPWGGLFTLALCVFDPNLIAHGRLATTDLGSTALLLIAMFWIWRLLDRPSWRHLLAAGVTFGLAQTTKFSALLFVPIVAGLMLLRAFVRRPFGRTLLPPRWRDRLAARQSWGSRLAMLIFAGMMVAIVALITLWGVYGFEVGPVPEQIRWPVPAPSHWQQFLNLSGRLAGDTGREAEGFLRGERYVGGRWDYFPIAFLIKTPIPTYIALAMALVLRIQTRIRRLEWVVWLPAAIYFGYSLTSNLNLGYRYILPVLPFGLVMAGRVGAWLHDRVAESTGARRTALTVGTILLVWSGWSALSIYPHYLAYFNEWVGGPEQGGRYLVDSNIDWGQDLKGLGVWMEANQIERIKLGYFGEAYPSYYGIDFEPLPSHPDRWEHPMYHDLYPANPSPGVYAISATLLQGVNIADPDTYAWFREQEPVDKIGYSISIYRVPLSGSGSVALALSNLTVQDVRPEDYVQLGTNDVRALWFDASRALVFPHEGERAVLALAGEAEVHPALAHLWDPAEVQRSLTGDGRPLFLIRGGDRRSLEAATLALASGAQVWHLPAAQFAPDDPAAHGERLSYPVQFGDPLELVAYEVEGDVLLPGETLTVVTYWRVRGPAAGMLKLFVHLLDEKSGYVSGQDRLDVWYDNWLSGDRFVQVQEVTLPEDIAAGEYQIEIGWYDPDTMQRLPVIREGRMIADRVLLDAIDVDVSIVHSVEGPDRAAEGWD